MLDPEIARELLALQALFAHLPQAAALSEMLHGENLALYHLYCNDTACPTQLSQVMHVSTARIAALLRHLEEKGWVARSPAADDERRVRITLTAAGHALVQEKVACAHACICRLLSPLRPAEAQQYFHLQKKLLLAAIGSQAEPQDKEVHLSND